MGTTLTAKKLVASSLAGSGSFTAPSHVAWGSGSTAFSESDTSLDTETQRNSTSSVNLNGTTIEFEGVLTATQLVGSTVREAGLLNAASGGSLFARDVFSSIAKTNQFELETFFVFRVK